MKSSSSSSYADYFFGFVLLVFHAIFTLGTEGHRQCLTWYRCLHDLLPTSKSLKGGSEVHLTKDQINDHCQILTKRPSHLALAVLEQGPIPFKVRTLDYSPVYLCNLLDLVDVGDLVDLVTCFYT